MENIRISLAEVSSAANHLSALNNQIYEVLNAMKRDINSTEGTWLSDGGREIRSKFNSFSNRFEQQRAVINEYVRFLNMTVSSYDTLETTITGNAASMSS